MHRINAYIRSVEGDLDWSLLEQLHSVVLQISSFCFRTKQICITVLIGVVGAIAAFSESEIDQSIFVAGYLVPICFWFLDSTAFYYQVKIRGAMDDLRETLKKRGGVPEDALEADVIEDERIDQSQLKITFDAFFNHSMWLYVILVLINSFVYFLFYSGKIA